MEHSGGGIQWELWSFCWKFGFWVACSVNCLLVQLREKEMACVKLGSKTDAFQRQGQAWYVFSFLFFYCYYYLVLSSRFPPSFPCRLNIYVAARPDSAFLDPLEPTIRVQCKTGLIELVSLYHFLEIQRRFCYSNYWKCLYSAALP